MSETTTTVRPWQAPLISLLSTNFRGGGVQISMLRKARRLMAMGFEVEMLVFERDGPLLDYYGDDIAVVELAPGSALLGRWLAVQADPGGIGDYLRPVLLARPPPHRLGFLSSLARYLREHRPEALITAGSGPNMLAIWARRLADVSTRVIVSQRDIISPSINNDRRWRRLFLPPALRRTYAMADAVVAVSNGVAEDLTAVTGLPREPSRSSIIPSSMTSSRSLPRLHLTILGFGPASRLCCLQWAGSPRRRTIRL